MKTSFLKRLTAGFLSFIMLMSAVNFSVFADFVIGTDGGKQKLYVSSANNKNILSTKTASVKKRRCFDL